MIRERTYSNIEKKVLEHPSTRLRLRAACNEQKKEHLDTKDIDTEKEQGALLFSKILGEPFKEKAYGNMWKGHSYPQNRTLSGFTNSAKQWLNCSNYTNPIMRHLFCIDAACFGDISKTKEDKNKRKDKLNKAFEAINTVWEILTCQNHTTSNSPFDYFNQVADSELTKATNNLHTNINSVSLPNELHELYKINDPSSIFRFLSAYADTCGIEDSGQLDLWSMDMASLSILSHAVSRINSTKNTTSPLGNLGYDHRVYLMIFFAPDEVIYKSKLYQHSLQDEKYKTTFLAYTAFRNSYRSQLKKIGITQKDLDSLLKEDEDNDYPANIGLR